jgi:hypothetical protein
VAMARVIQRNCGKDVLEVVKWREIFVIYVQSVILNLFAVVKNVLIALKRRLDPTRQNFIHKFPALSLIGSSEVKVQTQQQQQSIACPRQLMDPQLGNHKYIKLKVRKKKKLRDGSEEIRKSKNTHFGRGILVAFSRVPAQFDDLFRVEVTKNELKMT